MANSTQRWTNTQLKLAFYLYCQLPFGKLHANNPHIKKMATFIGRTSNALAMKLVNFASLDPAIRSTGRKGLQNASQADRKIWDLFHNDWNALAEECETLLKSNTVIFKMEDIHETNDFTGGTRDVITKARIGQNFFRRSVLASYEGICCMSGVSIPELLIASHIIPWANTKENRLNPSNGLCLSAIHDRAFDKGLISVDTNYNIVIAKQLKLYHDIPQIDILIQLEGKGITLPKKFYPDKDFLAWHNLHVFKG
jgi:predicted restriction endonuclease